MPKTKLSIKQYLKLLNNTEPLKVAPAVSIERISKFSRGAHSRRIPNEYDLRVNRIININNNIITITKPGAHSGRPH